MIFVQDQSIKAQRLERAESRVKASRADPRTAEKVLKFCKAYSQNNDIAESAKEAGCKTRIESFGKAILDDLLCQHLIDCYREKWAIDNDRLAMNAGIDIGNISAQATRKDIITAEDKRVLLSKFARLAGDTMDAKDIRNAISSISEMNKMDGDLAPTKSETKGTVEHKYESLSDDELNRKIAELERQLKRH